MPSPQKILRDVQSSRMYTLNQVRYVVGFGFRTQAFTVIINYIDNYQFSGIHV